MEQVFEYERNLRSFDSRNRLEYYRTSQFENDISYFGRLFRDLGISEQEIQNYIQAASSARIDALRLLDAPDIVYPLPRPINYQTDQHMVFLTSIVNSVANMQATQLAQRLLTEVNAEYSIEMRTLARLLPNELQTSRRKLDDALNSFATGHRDEAVLYTRDAWEACVSFGLSRLPGYSPPDGHDSHRQRAIFVIDKINETYQSRLTVSVKQLFETQFLHFFEAPRTVRPEEIPFFIAYTTGFAHLVAYYVLKPNPS